MIEVYVHGRGRGHATRMASVVDALRAAGHVCRVYAGGDARDLFPEAEARPPILPGPGVIRRLVQRIASDRAALRARPPDLLISDGDQAAVTAARVARVPSIAVGHGLVFSSCRLPRTPAPWSLWQQRANVILPTTLATRRVPVHFLPAEPLGEAARVARPALDGIDPEAAGDDGFLLGYFYRDGERIVAALEARGSEVRAFGRGDGMRAFDREAFRTALHRCRGVVATAGSNLLAECIALGKPMLLVHHLDHHEQTLNAHLAAQAGVAITATGAECAQDAGAVVDRYLAAIGRLRRVDLLAVPPVTDVVMGLVDELVG